jgi:hypothetical protein
MLIRNLIRITALLPAILERATISDASIPFLAEGIKWLGYSYAVATRSLTEPNLLPSVRRTAISM